MNVNCKIALTDEERNVMFRRLTGKNGKGMVSRADVNNWIKDHLQSFLTLGSPTTEQIDAVEVIDEVKMTDDEFDNLEQGEVEWVIKQNRLLTTRVNRLQYLLDRK